MAIEVTVRDTETGDTDTAVVEDYVLICAAPCRLDSRQAHANGTHVLTVKEARRALGSVRIGYEPDQRARPDVVPGRGLGHNGN